MVGLLKFKGRNMQKKVLVVDEEDLLRNLLAQIIQNSGYFVEQSKNKEKAVEIYKKTNPDIVIINTINPSADGIQIAESILKNDSDAVIVVLTSFSSTKNNELLKVGVKEVIEKPFKSVDLIDVIKKHTE